MSAIAENVYPLSNYQIIGNITKVSGTRQHQVETWTREISLQRKGDGTTCAVAS